MAESTGPGDDGGTHSGGHQPLVSVVVITHNEATRIGACLESIFEACAPLDRFEVVLVDSRSSDGTLDVAREFPITILQLPADAAITPSAGRYVGTAATSGDLVLFVDGDMVLESGWLEAACRRVREDPRLAGVDGHLGESNTTDDRATDVLRGVALYDRTALESVGGFDPHLQSLEDIDLSYRLAAEGYRLVRLAAVVANHPVSDGNGERWRRWRNGYYHGRGELFRKYVGRPRLFARLAYRTRLYLAMFAWVCVGVAAFIVGGFTGAALWALATALTIVGSILGKGADWTVDKIANAGTVFAGIPGGAIGSHPAPAAYPIDRVEVLETAPSSADAVGARAR